MKKNPSYYRVRFANTLYSICPIEINRVILSFAKKSSEVLNENFIQFNLWDRCKRKLPSCTAVSKL